MQKQRKELHCLAHGCVFGEKSTHAATEEDKSWVGGRRRRRRREKEEEEEGEGGGGRREGEKLKVASLSSFVTAVGKPWRGPTLLVRSGCALVTQLREKKKRRQTS